MIIEHQKPNSSRYIDQIDTRDDSTKPLMLVPTKHYFIKVFPKQE